eukprot:g32349.t1
MCTAEFILLQSCFVTNIE